MMRVSSCTSSETFKSRLCRSARGMAVAVAASVAALQPARATTIVDPAGDFLATYTGPHNGDLDVLSASAVQNGTSVTLTANLNGAIVQVEDGQGGTFPSPASPARFPGADQAVRPRSPTLGEHTREVLAEIGYSEAEIEAIFAAEAAA